MPAGSPVSPAITTWFYDDVKPDLWVATGSGGTDCCTGLRRRACRRCPSGPGRSRPARSGWPPRRGTTRGTPSSAQVGELVITAADAVDAAVLLGRRRRRPLPRQLLRDLPRRLAARRLLRGQRARRLLRARPLRRRAQPAGRAHRHRRDLPRRRGRPRRPRRAGRQPRPARRRRSSCRCSSSLAPGAELDDELQARLRREAPRGVHAAARARPRSSPSAPSR